MTASYMVVWKFLSVVNWNPADRKLTAGGHLLILRGMQFGPRLFPELVMLHNYVAPLINSSMHQEVPLWTVGPFQPTDPMFPGLPGDLELFTMEEVAKLKELGVLNPLKVTGCLPLSCCWCPPAGVKSCLPRWVHHLPILIHRR